MKYELFYMKVHRVDYCRHNFVEEEKFMIGVSIITGAGLKFMEL